MRKPGPALLGQLWKPWGDRSLGEGGVSSGAGLQIRPSPVSGPPGSSLSSSSSGKKRLFPQTSASAGTGGFSPAGALSWEVLEAFSSEAFPPNGGLSGAVSSSSSWAGGPGFCSAERGGAAVQLEARYGSSEEALRAARRLAKEDSAQQAFQTFSTALELDEDSAQICDEFGQFLGCSWRYLLSVCC